MKKPRPVPTILSWDPLVPTLIEMCEELLAGKRDPYDVPMLFETEGTPFLDALGREIFDAAEAETKTEEERRRVRGEHGGFRIVRAMSRDDLATVAWWVVNQLKLYGQSTRLSQLVDALRAYEPILTHEAERVH